MSGQKYMRFQDRKKRIISYISNSQHQYDVLNHQFYFYSKEVRTEIIHKGKNLIDMIPLNKINSLLQNLLLLIYDFFRNHHYGSTRNSLKSKNIFLCIKCQVMKLKM